VSDQGDAPIGEPGPNEPGVARGAQSLIEVLADLAAEGYDGEFRITRDDPARLECLRGGHTFAPGDARVSRIHRLEGASDPDEMLLIAAVQCPVCGALGVVTIGYGPAADEGSASVLEQLPDPAPEREIG
jgi:hypothetical protein